nr:hypothetical protein [uncultured Lichenicoccus sp.]
MQLTDAGTSFRMRRAVLCAVLWCVIVSITETINQPLTGITLHEQVSFLALVASSYMTCGLIWAVGAELPASRRRPLLAFALQLVAATAADVASNELVPLFMSHSSSMASILFTAPFPDFIGHAFWGNAFFGGLFVAAHRFTQQNLELHRRLARLRLVLGESEMRLREARVQSLQEQLRPATLVQALHAMRASYIRDPRHGRSPLRHPDCFPAPGDAGKDGSSAAGGRPQPR